MGKTTERLFLPLIKKQLPEIVDLSLPLEGVFHNFCFVSIKKRYPGQTRKIMLVQPSPEPGRTQGPRPALRALG